MASRGSFWPLIAVIICNTWNLEELFCTNIIWSSLCASVNKEKKRQFLAKRFSCFVKHLRYFLFCSFFEMKWFISFFTWFWTQTKKGVGNLVGKVSVRVRNCSTRRDANIGKIDCSFFSRAWRRISVCLWATITNVLLIEKVWCTCYTAVYWYFDSVDMCRWQRKNGHNQSGKVQQTVLCKVKRRLKLLTWGRKDASVECAQPFHRDIRENTTKCFCTLAVCISVGHQRSRGIQISPLWLFRSSRPT